MLACCYLEVFTLFHIARECRLYRVCVCILMAGWLWLTKTTTDSPKSSMTWRKRGGVTKSWRERCWNLQNANWRKTADLYQVCYEYYEIIRNFPLFCLSLIGREGIYLSVPQSEYTANRDLWCILGVSIFSYAKLTSVGSDKNAVILSLATSFVKEIPNNLIKQ